MKFQKKILFSMPVALIALAAATPAFAQYWGLGVPPPDYSGRIPPQHIEAMVRSMGFQPVADPRVRGPLWVTHAVDQNGHQVRVLIDSFSGRVIDVLRRPLPPQRLAAVPPPDFPPSANGAVNDYEGPDYDYRDMPRQRPADWPPPVPRVQKRGPEVISATSRDDDPKPARSNKKPVAKKEAEKKAAKTAAVKQEKANEPVPSPVSRPQDAPKAELPKPEAPKSSEVPTFVPNADQKTASSAPPVQPLEMKRGAPANAAPPVQPPF